MDLVSSIVVYILLWWWVFLMVLPFGSVPPETSGKGHAASAPANPAMFKKIIATTICSAFLFVVVKLIIESEIFSFR